MRAEKPKVNRLLKTARGQIDGILKMVEDDRYCIDISNQLLAVQAILSKVNKEIMHKHIEGCVKEAITEGNVEEKLEEVIKIMDKMTK